MSRRKAKMEAENKRESVTQAGREKVGLVGNVEQQGRIESNAKVT